MMMDMPVMVAAIIGMSGNVPSPVVVIVAAGGTVKMESVTRRERYVLKRSRRPENLELENLVQLRTRLFRQQTEVRWRPVRGNGQSNSLRLGTAPVTNMMTNRGFVKSSTASAFCSTIWYCRS